MEKKFMTQLPKGEREAGGAQIREGLKNIVNTNMPLEEPKELELPKEEPKQEEIELNNEEIKEEPQPTTPNEEPQNKPIIIDRLYRF